MPLKKKRCFPALNPKVGIAKQYLIDNYTLSSDTTVNKCQNGHVLLIYLQSSKSATHTVKFINEKFDFKASVSNVNALIMKTRRLYHCASKPLDRQRFQEICKADFVYNTTPTTTTETDVGLPVDEPLATAPCQNEPSEPFQMEPSTLSSSTEHCSSLVDSTLKYNYTTRGVTPSPREQLLKNRLKFLSISNSKLKSRHREKISLLKEKIKTNPIKIKHLNQTIKRKKTTIQILRQKLAQNSTGDLQKAKREIKHLNRRIKIIKEKNKEKIKTMKDTVYAEFTEKLKMKDDQIKALQQRVTTLEDRIEELNSAREEVSL